MKVHLRSDKIFWLRIGISSISILLIVLHLFVPNFTIDTISIVLIFVAILPWLSPLLESAEFPGGWKFKFRKLEEPTEYVEITNLDDEAAIIVNHGEHFELQSLQVAEPPNLLVLKARINYKYEAGAQYLMKVYVNNTILKSNTLINKPIIRKIQDGREIPWFNAENNSWGVCYSPNFKSNYFHHSYRVINGDPYTFIFDLSEIEPDDNYYHVTIEHNGKKGNPAYLNSIIVMEKNLL